jgi:hypothetical protein
MFDLKICAIAAAAAFLVSALLGLVGGVGAAALILRALVLAAFFFGFAAGAQFLVARFLPELLNPASVGEEGESFDEVPRAGGRVDLSVGDDADSGGLSFGGDGTADRRDDEELEAVGGPSSDSDPSGGANSSPGLDQEVEGGYTVAGGSVARTEALAARPPDLIGDVDVLPDLESLSDSFITPVNLDSGADGDSAPGTPPSRSASGSARTSSGGSADFDAKEMAMAIQTILKRDGKG